MVCVRGMSFRHQQQTCKTLFRVRLGVRGCSLLTAGLVLSRSRFPLAKTNSLFHVEEDSWDSVGDPSRADSTVAEGYEGTFAEWLSREIPISTINWSIGSTVSTTIYPLYSMLMNSTVLSNRLKNYANFRFDAIKLRVVINATPFCSGMLMGSFTPLSTLGTAAALGTSTKGEAPFFSGGVSEVEQGVSVPGCATTDFCYVMARSQRSPVFANVSNSQGFEYTIPWRHYRDSLVVDTTWPTATGVNFVNQFYNFGYFTLESLGVPLRTGSATTVPVTVLIYASFVNPRVWGPTFTAQSGVLAVDTGMNQQSTAPRAAGEGTPALRVSGENDERGNAMKPSQIASAVADAAGALSSVPVIGFWATATSIVARGTSAILRLFGWSNPPIITGRAGYQLYSNPHSVNPQVSRQDDVVALDPRNEVTVDPRLTGGPAVDELVIDTWCRRPVVLDTFKYNVADAVGTLLFSIPVTPNHCYQTYVNNVATGSIPCVRVSMPPYTYAAQAFDQWRGRFHIRITPIISAFHKGSIKIWWDPIGYGTTNSIGIQKTVIHEIASGPVDFFVDFAAAVGFLSVDTSPISNTTSASVAATNYWGNRAAATPVISDNLTRYFNGVLNVQVLNRLQGDSDVNCVVQTWFEDMQFAVPRADNDVLKGTINQVAVTNFVTQSGVISKQKPDHLALLYPGERVESLRTLLNRSSIWRVLQMYTTPSGGTAYNSYNFPRFPLARNAIVKDIVGGSTKYFNDDTYGTYLTQGTLVSNWCNTTPLAYFARCFVGHRGSIIWRAQPFDAANGDVGGIFGLARMNVRTANTVWGRIGQMFSANTNAGTLLMQRLIGSGSAGVLNCTSVDRVTGGMFPSYFKYRMMGGDSNHYLDATVASGNEWDVNMFNYEGIKYFAIGSLGINRLTQLCCAAGPDFAPLEFLSCPDVYVATVTYPTP